LLQSKRAFEDKLSPTTQIAHRKKYLKREKTVPTAGFFYILYFEMMKMEKGKKSFFFFAIHKAFLYATIFPTNKYFGYMENSFSNQKPRLH
jgi:hypothetical protein